MSYAELFCRSHFSFLEGTSSPEQLVQQAAALGLEALALTDRDGVYGLVQAHRAARQHGVHLVAGALLTVRAHPSLVLLVEDGMGWSNLCRLLTEGRRGQPKGRALHAPEAVLAHAEGLHALLVGPWSPAKAAPFAEAFGERIALGVGLRGLASDDHVLESTLALSRCSGLPVAVVGEVLMHTRSCRRLLDVLTCIRRRTTVERAGRSLAPNGQRFLRSSAEMAVLYEGRPGPWAAALARTAAIAARCRFDLSQLDYRYPREVVPTGHEPMGWLRELCRRGLAWRYPQGPAAGVVKQVERELAIIEQLKYPAYFLTVYDMVRFARERGILCQGRGSAANSAVCFVLGITAVDPAHSQLLFERFISPERNEPPDIDVDFEHERREEVLQYVYERYGRHRAAMVNEVICYRRRSAVRDVGKALGLSLDQVDNLARTVEGWHGTELGEEHLRQAGLDPADRRVQLTLELSDEIRRLPRHVSIHVGGMVLTDDALIGRVPVEPATMEGRTVIQWDKDDIDEVGFVKVDLLSLGMLTAIRKCFQLVAHCKSGQDLDPAYGRCWSLASVPPEDPAVYDMICRADTVGVFQIESRAQMSMLPRLRPRNFYDLVVEVSIVRPGPIQGGMVHPYLMRRQGKEPITYPHPKLVPILERTLGVPIFQEQVMAMAVAVAGFTPGQADELRRAMGAWRKKGTLGVLSEKLYAGLLANGIEGEYADQVVKQIQGFGEYGFPESHAASFAHLVYVSAWLRCHYLPAFVAALLNSQPMGFYSPSSLLADARRHGVDVRPVDVCHSHWDCTLEPGIPEGRTVVQPAIRLGFRMVRGTRRAELECIEARRQEAAFTSFTDLVARTALSRAALAALAQADAFGGLGLDRRQALWRAEGLWQLPLFAGMERSAHGVVLPVAAAAEELREDYRATGTSLRHHPVALLRKELTQRGVASIGSMATMEHGQWVRLAGMVTSRQRPGTASGVLFMNLEDETGMANIVVWPRLYERQRRLIRGENLLELTGRLQRADEAMSVVAYGFRPLAGATAPGLKSRDFR